MKIVRNSDYGGFGLSYEAVKLYAKKKGFEIYAYEENLNKYDKGNKSKKDEYIRIDRKPSKRIWIIYWIKKDLGKVINELPNDSKLWLSPREIPRDDKDLVAVVDELGEKADGDYAKLEIVDIPDDITWHMDDYDGIETIHEEHRSW